MRILVLGGTLFFGKHMVREFIRQGDSVTIATRGRMEDGFGEDVERIILDRTDEISVANALNGKAFDIVCDNTCYSSDELRYILEHVQCKRYILTSTISVYTDQLSLGLREEDYNPFESKLVWCTREDAPYGILKQRAEAALFQRFSEIPGAAIRFPYVVGVDDYTNRLYNYCRSIRDSKPVYIDNMEEEISFIHSEDAGKFLAYVAKSTGTGPINATAGTMKIGTIVNYIESKTGKKAIIDKEGEKAAYNEVPSFSVVVDKANHLGYEFQSIEGWMFNLIDELLKGEGSKGC